MKFKIRLQMCVVATFMSMVMYAEQWIISRETTNSLVNAGWCFTNVGSSNEKNGMTLKSENSKIASPKFLMPLRMANFDIEGAGASVNRAVCFVGMYNGNIVTSAVSKVEGVVVGMISVEIPDDMLIDSFELKFKEFEGDEGNLIMGKTAIYFSKCTLEYSTRVFPSYGVQAKALYCDGIELGWKNALGTAKNIVNLWRVDNFPDRCDVTNKVWSFTAAENEGGNSKNISDDEKWSEAGMMVANIYVGARTNGFIQIGATTKQGEIILPRFDIKEGMALGFEASRYSSTEGKWMPLKYSLNNETNTFYSVELTDDFNIYYVPLTEVPDGARISFHSTTNNKSQCRVLLKNIVLVEGYSPAEVVTNSIRRNEFPAAEKYKVRDLLPGVHLVRVDAISSSNIISEGREVIEVELLPGMEKLHTGLSIRIK